MGNRMELANENHWAKTKDGQPKGEHNFGVRVMDTRIPIRHIPLPT